ncbi:MAG: hypothetical protein DRJ50_08030 [Actinobacteria bacterium]|nr:MAG: hypothetical protein DRJ50_08030 [Actinomycetota bacterium]
MITYFDTSALIPLVINEPSSEMCQRLWNDATQTISTRLIYPEARAALAQAKRIRRLTAAHLARAVKDLDSVASEINYLEITAHIAESAGALAEAHELGGYDAVLLASAELPMMTTSCLSPATATSGLPLKQSECLLPSLVRSKVPGINRLASRFRDASRCQPFADGGCVIFM